MIDPDKHYHTYKRVKGSKEQFMCMDPDCNHTNVRKYMVGKRARCYVCGELYIIRKRVLQLATPHCDNCTKSKKQTQAVEDDAAIDSFLGDM